jgi:hypothetical protein
MECARKLAGIGLGKRRDAKAALKLQLAELVRFLAVTSLVMKRFEQ